MNTDPHRQPYLIIFGIIADINKNLHGRRKFIPNNGKIIIGLTGKYCAGKNFIANILEQRQISVLDVDKLGHTVIETEKNKILARFGNEILGDEGQVDRKKLGQKVFGNANELKALEEIVHPAVNRETIAWIDAQKEKLCVINAALLHKSSAMELLNAVILINAPFLIRLIRAKRRDKLPLQAILKRFRSQSDLNSHFYGKGTDIYRVENSGFFAATKKSAKKRLEKHIDEILSAIRSS